MKPYAGDPVAVKAAGARSMKALQMVIRLCHDAALIIKKVEYNLAAGRGLQDVSDRGAHQAGAACLRGQISMARTDLIMSHSALRMRVHDYC